MLIKYLPAEFEKKWVEEWEKNKVYKVIKSVKSEKKKQYILAMFPYPSGAGLHVGHVRNYTGTDVVARYFRMNNYSVLHPMGWDAFGLPAENAAVKAKKNPMDMVPEHIATFKKQMKSLGFSYDWEKEFSTTDPAYYKWTQWLFIQFYKMGLLYKKNAPINYCPKCKTGLAEEEVLPNGTHERCGNKIEKRDLPQWLFKITKYADRLLADLEGLNWPKGILEMQKNWIGKKEGININYNVKDSSEIITCFTTAPVNFGMTFIVVSPEHKFIKKIISGEIKIPEDKLKDIKKYVKSASEKTEQERLNERREKTGVFTGLYAYNPVAEWDVPIWITDFVLANVGTGAVQGCPGHDYKDFEFAKKFNLPIIRVVVGKNGDQSEIKESHQVIVKGMEGKMVNSKFLNGLKFSEGLEKTMNYIEKKGWGKRVTTYHLHDWIFSRQRYWGEPIPMVFCEKCQWQPISEDQLPLKLPYVKSYEPTKTGESPLSVIPEFVNTTCPKCGGEAKRETDTMPNWAGSCWYFIAFAFWEKSGESEKFLSRVNSSSEESSSSYTNSRKNFPASPSLTENFKLKIENSGNLLPVDWYLGGAEHAVLHLLYSRFWVKALYDLKLLNFKEPFLRLRNQGMVLAEDHRKMSKSLGNVINPDDVISEFGADALRVYEMFMAPFNQEISWATKSLQGSYRFVKRVWDIFQQYNNETMKQSNNEDKQLVIKLQKTIKKVTSDIPEIKFNTSIAAMMEFLNDFESASAKASADKEKFPLSKENAKKFLQILAPFAPFMAEEIWHEVFGEKQSIHLSTWPKLKNWLWKVKK
ncbi:MAG: Leucine-tRNA ligase [Candidatus Roizmanbacteria bacterium GW2011_GWA2_34_18]|uniref:Leucine--tRNA ligase n=1 Tax=Candidatus Roizmanbacteria bacterium GW2011_GWA2_34_18 TaxID=1618477 RepID=A0A0G0DVJ3_9BACT|nr:MAG: Leucine-tRNA ligase [Candidatus Roizmanbacteria bacterium GW2011_GWA2_34_18]